MIDVESMIKSLRLAWLKRIFQCNNGAWRSFLRFSLEPFGGLFYFTVIMTLKRYIFPLHYILSYFNGGLSFEAFSTAEGNVNIFGGITKRYALIAYIYIKNFLNKISFS